MKISRACNMNHYHNEFNNNKNCYIISGGRGTFQRWFQQRNRFDFGSFFGSLSHNLSLSLILLISNCYGWVYSRHLEHENWIEKLNWKCTVKHFQWERKKTVSLMWKIEIIIKFPRIWRWFHISYKGQLLKLTLSLSNY